MKCLKGFVKSFTAVFCCTVFFMFLLAGCGVSKQQDLHGSTQNGIALVQNVPDLTVTSNTTVEADINKNDSGKTVIKVISKSKDYPNNSYMLISKGGTVVVCDPFLAVAGIKPDIITSTHSHSDHIDYTLDKSTNCKKSYHAIESFNVKDARVYSIAASHRGDDIFEEFPSDIIYVYEIDGLRIAHMGDIGQDTLSDVQLKELGRIDIAFMQFVNPYSDYSLENGKGFKLIEQLKPQIIIPTHSSAEATKKIGEMVGAYESVRNILTVSKEDLQDGKRKVIEIKNTFGK